MKSVNAVWVLVLVRLLASPASASTADCADYRYRAMDEIDRAETSFKSQVQADQAEIRKLEMSGDIPGMPLMNAPCRCEARYGGCTAEFWKKLMGYPDPEKSKTLPDGGCVEIYKRLKSDLPFHCRNLVVGKGATGGCGKVRRIRRIVEIRREIAEAEDRLRALRIARADENREYRECVEDESEIEDEANFQSVYGRGAKVIRDDIGAGKTGSSDSEASRAGP